MKKITILLFVLITSVTNSYSQITKSDFEKVLEHIDISNPSVITLKTWLKINLNEYGKIMQTKQIYAEVDLQQKNGH
jgi:hypothetical protein